MTHIVARPARNMGVPTYGEEIKASGAASSLNTRQSVMLREHVSDNLISRAILFAKGVWTPEDLSVKSG